MTEQEYDRLYNEGGDGFNPYRYERIAKANAGEPLWSKVESRMSKIQRLLNGIGDAAFDRPRKEQLESELATLKALYATLDK